MTDPPGLEEAIEVAARAISLRVAGIATPGGVSRAYARAAVAAAYPVIEKAVRGRVAQEIEAAGRRETKSDLDYYEIYISEAARIARGDSDG